MSAPWSPTPLALPAMTSSISVDGTPVRCTIALQALGQQLLRVDVVQGAVLLALAARGAHPVDDPGLALTHGLVTPCRRFVLGIQVAHHLRHPR